MVLPAVFGQQPLCIQGRAVRIILEDRRFPEACCRILQPVIDTGFCINLLFTVPYYSRGTGKAIVKKVLTRPGIYS
jgi:hypothetical protein